MTDKQLIEALWNDTLRLRGALRDEPFWAPEVRAARIAEVLAEHDEVADEYHHWLS